MVAVPSAGLTQWSRFDVPGMWSLLRNVSTVEAFQQAGAWQSTYEAAQSLARRLQWYRDGLADKWSPDSSEAAALYLGRLDELIGSAQQLADVSVANRQALVTLANAVDEARPKLQRVYEESQALRQIESQPKAVASVASRQQQLHKQATEIMESLGDAAMDSWRHYATADDYQPPQPPIRGGNLLIAGDTPAPPTGEITADSSFNPDAPEAYAQYRPQKAAASSDVGQKGRFKPQMRSPDSEPLSLAASDAEQHAAVGESNFGRPGGAPPTTVHDSISGPAAQMSIERAEDESAIETRSAGGWRTELDDGIRSIKAPDVIGRRKGGQLEEAVTPRSRTINPVGGVISGEENAGLGLTGMGPGNVARMRSEYRRRREYDVDDPWYVPEGVTSILSPGLEPSGFEAGPGIIGIDR